MIWKIKRIYWDISWWMGDRLPGRCFRCGQWRQHRHLRHETHWIAGLVLLCQECRRELFGAAGA